jgi:hypothetical protein
MSHAIEPVQVAPGKCACGNPGVKRKAKVPVCERCDRIEQQLEAENRREGQTHRRAVLNGRGYVREVDTNFTNEHESGGR